MGPTHGIANKFAIFIVALTSLYYGREQVMKERSEKLKLWEEREEKRRVEEAAAIAAFEAKRSVPSLSDSVNPQKVTAVHSQNLS